MADSSARAASAISARAGGGVNNGLNLLLSQALWLAAVGGAAYGLPWLGPLALLVFALVQLSAIFARAAMRS